jgi:serine/threonine protein kinase
MGCCASSEAAVDAPARGNKDTKKALGGGVLREASTKELGNNCSEGHPLQKYDLMDTLGTGGFAVVKRVRDKFTSENFAMKIINVSFDGSQVRPGANPREPSTAQFSNFSSISPRFPPRTPRCDPNACRATCLAVHPRATVPHTHR